MKHLTYPISRLRRLRISKNVRRLMRETRVTSDDLIYPIFVRSGKSQKQEISSMPGIYQFSPDSVMFEVERVVSREIPAVLLFGIPAEKDSLGSGNFNPEGVIQNTVRNIKKEFPELLVVTDVCMCEYTDHGHCGIINTGDLKTDNKKPDGYVLNDPTLEILSKVAVSHADAGSDWVAPSGMMDGMVKSIRKALDVSGFDNTSILSYSIKYASAYYGPFRDAAESPPSFGDRKSHQMDPANVREALREASIDINEGTDVIMVKPALPYLDVIQRVRNEFPEIPLAAYNVSGEYSMVKAAAQRGWLDERSTVLETLTSIKRAGADMIITYHALDFSDWVK